LRYYSKVSLDSVDLGLNGSPVSPFQTAGPAKENARWRFRD